MRDYEGLHLILGSSDVSVWSYYADLQWIQPAPVFVLILSHQPFLFLQLMLSTPRFSWRGFTHFSSNLMQALHYWLPPLRWNIYDKTASFLSFFRTTVSLCCQSTASRKDVIKNLLQRLKERECSQIQTLKTFLHSLAYRVEVMCGFFTYWEGSWLCSAGSRCEHRQDQLPWSSEWDLQKLRSLSECRLGQKKREDDPAAHRQAVQTSGWSDVALLLVWDQTRSTEFWTSWNRLIL